jgi:hypothetical protein
MRRIMSRAEEALLAFAFGLYTIRSIVLLQSRGHPPQAELLRVIGLAAIAGVEGLSVRKFVLSPNIDSAAIMFAGLIGVFLFLVT